MFRSDLYIKMLSCVLLTETWTRHVASNGASFVSSYLCFNPNKLTL